MINQFAYLKGTNHISQADKDKFDGYPGIVIKSHIASPMGHNYTIRFEHEKKLTCVDFGVSLDWIIGEQNCVSINPPKFAITNKK